ncbi:unnamed protein product [Caenorhabditis bovis]|uniref:Uncharacterized protein n=1 Tax=Caenorhabditis bovis TaxID=2654633 RepID=A0A8S1EU36_9PELO|nr:unnamed protein product [Caenorhabditis bovis]
MRSQYSQFAIDLENAANADDRRVVFAHAFSFVESLYGDACRLIVAVALPMTLVAVGVVERDECPDAPMLPVWLIVFAVGVLLAELNAFVADRLRRHAAEKHPEPTRETPDEARARKQIIVDETPTIVFVLDALLIPFLVVQLIWIALGCFWIIDTFDVDNLRCHWAPYWLTLVFAFLTAVVVLSATCLACYVLGRIVKKSLR